MISKINLQNIEAVTEIDDQIYDEIIFFTINKLIQNKQKITAAESLTAGMFLSSVANVPGASAILDGGFVTYANSAKENLLNIDHKNIEKYGVVSKQIAEQMAEKSRLKMQSDIGMGFTGVAGPESLENNPSGTVFIGLSNKNEVKSYQFLFEGSRKLVRQKTVLAGMMLIQRDVLKI